MNLFQWGDKLIAVISAVVTVFVSGLIAVIKFKTVVEYSQAELAFMTRYEKTKYKVYTYLMAFVGFSLSEMGMAYGIRQMGFVMKIVKMLYVPALLVGVVCFLVMASARDDDNPEMAGRGKTSIYTFLICITVLYTYLVSQMYAQNQVIEVVLFTICVAFLMSYALYCVSCQIYKVELAKAFYKDENGMVMYIYGGWKWQCICWTKGDYVII